MTGFEGKVKIESAWPACPVWHVGTPLKLVGITPTRLYDGLYSKYWVGKVL